MTVQETAMEIENQAQNVTATIHTVREQAQSAINAAEKTNANLQGLIEKRTQIINDLIQSAAENKLVITSKYSTQTA